MPNNEIRDIEQQIHKLIFDIGFEKIFVLGDP